MNSKDFAKLILEKAGDKNITLNYTQLQKIMYICDGVLLAHGNDLIDEQCQVWDYGPVYPNVYKWYSKQKTNTKYHFDNKNINTKEIDDVINAVLDKFGRMTATSLSIWSHQIGSPWAITKNMTGMYSKISKDVMKLYFKTEMKI